MSSTTQILFNSPALHSLKRDQLVKLCKTHSLRANGKNVDLIQRLKQHAATLPNDAPLSIAARSEEETEPRIPIQLNTPPPEDQQDHDMLHAYHAPPRLSEQWEIVMDSIEELEENSQGTTSSQSTINNTKGGVGEFGTGSSKSTTVSSSIKALASSLGIKRNQSKATTSSSSKNSGMAPKDELAQISVPYSSLPSTATPPQTDHFTLNSSRSSLVGVMEDHIPGHALRPGVPAPANARLSLGLGLGAPATPTRRNQPTTTIRLITNTSTTSNGNVNLPGQPGTPQLKPFDTAFDLILGSPAPAGSSMNFGFGSMSTWPPSEYDPTMKDIYPKLTFDDLPPAIPSPSPSTKMSSAVSGPFTPSRASLAINTPTKKPEPFLFGSPLPQHNVSNDQFRTAAASVLEEMNQRLREEGVDEIGTDIISKLHPDAKARQELSSREIKPIPNSRRGEISVKFDKFHSQEEKKMEGIDTYVKRRADKPSVAAPEVETQKAVGKKRKSSALESENPGGGPRRPSMAPRRVSSTRVISTGRRAKALPGAFGLDDDDDSEEENDDRGGKRVRVDSDTNATAGPSSAIDQKQLDREEMEKEALRRKLEASRARRRSSAVAGRKSGRLSTGGRPRPSVLIKPKPKPSRFGFLSSAKTLVQSVWNRGKGPVPPSNLPKAAPPKPEPAKKPPPPALAPPKKTTVAPAQATTTVANGTRSSLRSNGIAPKPEDKATLNSVASSARSRSPIPSFGVADSTKNSLQSNAGTRTSRNSTLFVPGARTSAGMSSIGTRLSTRSSLLGPTPVSSMGSKRTSVSSRTSSMGPPSRPSTTSSRLLAPTASSLAKANRPSGTGLKSALEPITNNLSSTNAGRPSGQASSPNPPQKPSLHQSAIPTPVKARINIAGGADAGEGVAKQRSLNGRKPRISRSKVIARLASQRQVSGSSTTSSIAPRTSNGAGKTRSSLGAKVARSSYGGGPRSRVSGAANMAMSAKKRARQSEYVRRRSQTKPLVLNPDASSSNSITIDDSD